jgi:redox-sensitive bicupin YhaK (pirin superfamily)
MNKQILHILEGRSKSIGEETILQSLPHKDFRFASPFIVIHHMPPHKYEPNSPAERIHPHPHRGFAPVTFMFQGEGYHKDSLGNSGSIKAGEVQWMFAGKGLLHSEGPTEKLLKTGGMYEFVQVWINVPARYKMTDANYQQAPRQRMPAILEQPGVDLRLASGQFENTSGPIKTLTPITTFFGSARANTTLGFSAQEGYWTLLYILDGKLIVNNNEVTAHHLVVFNKENTDINVEIKEDSKMLYLSGEPINEPVAAKGNIVMNTEEEIKQAEADYAAGKFGQLDF